ncbi:ABC transporter ATP-binding protein [Vibrio sp. S4M6]|uniref:ABC transporter ATP-binding protein n=1 Tax=Vibrio sinus TaxID=2946865 RepID=UPI00202A6E62|nr:ABC transporter ATP-binding protein [Vibrio sinus]MCL9781694.1 ABC transporter ATP-binding protein [Vibrio sinus]
MSVLVEASGVSKQYKHSSNHEEWAIKNVNFQLHAGQVMGLLGHNGAGKSTLIHSLLGAQYYQGDIKIMGMEPLSKRAEVMKSLAYISDGSHLPNWMTVQQILKYTSGVNPSFKIGNAKRLLADTKVTLKSKVGALSKGMKVQLHLAIILSTDVRILVLDEPTLGLDLMYRDVFYRQLLHWFQQSEKALIIASHEVDEIESLLTDVLILKNGQVVLSEPMSDLKHKYAVIDVANEYSAQIEQALNPIYSRPHLAHTEWVIESNKLAHFEPILAKRDAVLSDIFLAFQQGVTQ